MSWYVLRACKTDNSVVVVVHCMEAHNKIKLREQNQDFQSPKPSDIENWWGRDDEWCQNAYDVICGEVIWGHLCKSNGCGTACPKENTGSHLITEVRSCWAGSISGWITILVYPVLYALGVRLVSWSSLMPPTSAKACGLNLSWSQPDLGCFSGYSGFPPSPQKINSQLITSGWGLWSRIKHGPYSSYQECLSCAFSPILSSCVIGCTLREQSA